MKEILHHLGCIKPCKWWDFNYQAQLVLIPDLPSTASGGPSSKWWTSLNGNRMLQGGEHAHGSDLGDFSFWMLERSMEWVLHQRIIYFCAFLRWFLTDFPIPMSHTKCTLDLFSGDFLRISIIWIPSPLNSPHHHLFWIKNFVQPLFGVANPNLKMGNLFFRMGIQLDVSHEKNPGWLGYTVD